MTISASPRTTFRQHKKPDIPFHRKSDLAFQKIMAVTIYTRKPERQVTASWIYYSGFYAFPDPFRKWSVIVSV